MRAPSRKGHDMPDRIPVRIPTAWRKGAETRPLLRFLVNGKDNNPFASVTLPPGTRARTETGDEADVSFHEFTCPAEWVFIPYDATTANVAASVRTALCSLPAYNRDGGDFVVRLKRDMGDYDDHGTYVPHPQELHVTVPELERALEAQRNEYLLRCRQAAGMHDEAFGHRAGT